MATVRYILVYLALGTPRTGLWCPTCSLPSGVEWPVVALRPDGVAPVAFWRQCVECESRRVEG